MSPLPRSPRPAGRRAVRVAPWLLLMATAAAPGGDAPPARLLFEEVPDGRCQILSEGGKLVVLRNPDPARAVRFRLVRKFRDVPQGRLDGELPAGGEPLKLGCNRVDGRVQSWTVERANFIEESP